MHALLINLALGLLCLIFATFAFEGIAKKFRKSDKLATVVINKTTDDGENLTMQFNIPANLSPAEKFALVNEEIRAFEMRMQFVTERFQDLLAKERAANEEKAKLKSV